MKINLIHKNIAILWFWREWESTLNFLKSNWILDWSITILDKNPINVSWFSWKIVTWKDYLSDLEYFDYIFKSPWISPYLNWLEKYKDKILTQTKLFYEFYNWKIISVTQTKWKSTTATLCYQVLKNAWHNVKLVWNIWNPVFNEINLEKDNYDYVIYELSSYMLEDLENHHSYISILWNIYQDHLDWHLWFENYSKAKKNILKNSENILVWFDLYSKIEKDLLNRKFLTFGKKWSYISHDKNEYFINWENTWIIVSPKIPWEHNLDNFAWILWVCEITWIWKEIFIKTINEFSWLPHRLQNIWTYAWITFIDDAISTTPESTIEAIKTFKNDLETIFLWWTDRWYNFENLVNFIEQSKIENIILFPDSWINIKKWLKIDNFNILETNSMEEAIQFAFKNTSKNKICLLSTASPSYTLWENFEQKWYEFKKQILNQYKKFEQ